MRHTRCPIQCWVTVGVPAGVESSRGDVHTHMIKEESVKSGQSWNDGHAGRRWVSVWLLSVTFRDLRYSTFVPGGQEILVVQVKSYCDALIVTLQSGTAPTGHGERPHSTPNSIHQEQRPFILTMTEDTLPSNSRWFHCTDDGSTQPLPPVHRRAQKHTAVHFFHNKAAGNGTLSLTAHSHSPKHRGAWRQHNSSHD